MNNGLWVNCRRWRSSLTSDPCCPLCHTDEETIIHLFRDCNCIRPLWNGIVPQHMTNAFFNSEVKHWILENIGVAFGPFEFGLLLWAIWKTRNDVVFNQNAFSVDHILFYAKLLLLDWNKSSVVTKNAIASLNQPTYKQVFVGWSPPSPSWFKWNVDGSVIESTRLASSGGVCRDSTGNWKFGFCRNLGSSNVLWAELWAIATAITLSWDKGLRRVIIESDSQVATKLVNEGCDSCHPYASLVNQIRSCISRDWLVRCVHIYRETNQVADRLADLAHQCNFGLQILDSPPPSCLSLLLFDSMGTAFPRSILV